MEYLLTEEEMRALVPLKDLELAREALGWCFAKLQRQSCPHREENANMAYPYCDECPLDSSWKDEPERPSREISQLICTLPRQHSK